jgi:hypothetical protein
MSYDIYLRGNGQGEPVLPNPTYNLTPIFHVALKFEELPKCGDAATGLRVLNGRAASETVEQLEMSLYRIRDPVLRSVFKSLEPANGWGNMRDAESVLMRLLEAATEYPNHVWEVR